MRLAEPVEQQGLEIPKGNAPVDRSPSREGYKQCVGAPCRAFDPVRGGFNPRKARFEARDLRGISHHLLLGRWRLRGRDYSRGSANLGRLRADAKETSGAIVAGQGPGCTGGSGKDESQAKK
jgi:hypothetical protein